MDIDRRPSGATFCFGIACGVVVSDFACAETSTRSYLSDDASAVCEAVLAFMSARSIFSARGVTVCMKESCCRRDIREIFHRGGGLGRPNYITAS